MNERDKERKYIIIVGSALIKNNKLYFHWIAKSRQKYLIRCLTIISNPVVELVGPLLTIMICDIASVIAVHNPFSDFSQFPIYWSANFLGGNVCEGSIASQMNTTIIDRSLACMSMHKDASITQMGTIPSSVCLNINPPVEMLVR